MGAQPLDLTADAAVDIGRSQHRPALAEGKAGRADPCRGFVLARKHATRLRAIALVMFGIVPLFGGLLALAWPTSAPIALSIGAFAALIGTLVERWLFFAQARHLVTLYY